MVLTPIAFGVPANNPEDDKVAHAGNPVAVQVIGAVPPAANWNEYATPIVPAGNGLVLVIVGATPEFTMVKEKLCGPPLPAALVTVMGIELTPETLGVPCSAPEDESVAHAGLPTPAVQLIGVVPEAVNWKE